MFEIEEKFIAEGYEYVIGIDEAGRGPLAGPVVACAVIYRGRPSPAPSTGHPLPSTGEGDKDYFDLIRDSKLLSEKQREKLFDFICENFYVGVGISDHKTIDRINILEATYLAMKKAVTSLAREISNDKFPISNKIPNDKYQIANKSQISNSKFQNPDTKYQIQNTRYLILVDGNKIIPNFSMEQRAIVGGDKLVKSISAASIVAKVTRDRIMAEMHSKYPQYDFRKHKGYGTKVHMECLSKYGPCEIHRRSFGPVKKRIKN